LVIDLERRRLVSNFGARIENIVSQIDSIFDARRET
jgi:hypothetical protein